MWAERRSQWKDDAEGYVVTSPGALCGDSGAGEEESEQSVPLSSSIMAPIGLKAVVGESKRALLIVIQCVRIGFKNCMMMVMRVMAELAVLEVVVWEGVFCAWCFFFLILSGCGCEAAASRLRMMMKMKADLRPLYPMARLGLQRQLGVGGVGVEVVSYWGALPIRGPCAAAADAHL